MSATTIAPYLFFAGRCEEALDFYRTKLGAEVEMLMRFRDSPEPPPPGMLRPGFENKVMHAKFDGFRLALTVPTEADARKAFDALADGGSVQMPLTTTFWSPCYGMVTDRFNVGWMVMVAGPAN